MAFPVEIKVNIDPSRADVVEALGQRPTGGSTRQIWFAEERADLERGQLTLLEGSVFVRLRIG